MKKLWENTEVVDVLKRIIEKCKYVEYDEKNTKYWAERSGQNKLKIVITDPEKVSKNMDIAYWVWDQLCKATGIKFPIPQTSVGQTYFYIRLPEDQK